MRPVERHTFFAKKISELTTWIVQSSCREVKWTDDGTGTYGKSLVQTSALKMTCSVTSGESVHLLYLCFPISLCLTCLFNLEFVPRRALHFMCRAGALTPLLPLAEGQSWNLCFSHHWPSSSIPTSSVTRDHRLVHQKTGRRVTWWDNAPFWRCLGRTLARLVSS